MRFALILPLLFGCGTKFELIIDSETAIALDDDETGRLVFTPNKSGVHYLYLENMDPDDESFEFTDTDTDEVLSNPTGFGAQFELDLKADEKKKYRFKTASGFDASATLTLYEEPPGGDEGSEASPQRVSINSPHLGYVDEISHYSIDLSSVGITDDIGVTFLGEEGLILDMVFSQVYLDGTTAEVLTCTTEEYCVFTRSSFGTIVDELVFSVTPVGPAVRGAFELTISADIGD